VYAIRRPALVFSVSSGDLKAEYMEAKIASPPKEEILNNCMKRNAPVFSSAYGPYAIQDHLIPLQMQCLLFDHLSFKLQMFQDSL